jgi:hypothetical protein
MSVLKILSITILFMLLLNISTAKAGAFSSVLGVKTVLEEVRIEGIKIHNPDKRVTISNHSPTFSGYTLSNVKVILVIKSEGIQRESLTDANGYWSYTLNKSLKSGLHTLTVRIVDSNGKSGEEKKAATFQIIDKGTVLGVSSETLRSIPDYWTFTISVSFFLLLLLAAYVLIRRRVHLYS